ncbi:MAG: hypothetical protein K9J37_19115 [Saprospiraceae bacterium]|nr:hypothetical protein [Saprospiraceae bacterium]MCF8252035.1 hypothetical protein [Saprospiraceae bacterium]MCF8281724.1 hypothetical protein [Bacteroidales bacterium]MCF8310388.1 hypothetical protein [Saprospiraceae bacterium]MCF8439766.1 hypothetical protein [Saprospiraceae bacterium]
MKMTKLIFSSALVMGFVFTNCTKDESTTDQAATQQMVAASEDNSTAEDLYQNVDDQVDVVVEARGGGGGACPTVTVDPSWDMFPRTVTIDFGTDGCTGPDGRIRKGQIVVVQTAEWWVPDAERTTTFIGFSVDGAQLEGTATLVNQGYDANGNITLTRTVAGAKITFPNDDVTTWETQQQLTQIEGGGTPLILLDNVFEFTSISSGINRNGQAFTVETITPLVKHKLCPWLVSGIIQLDVAGKTLQLDYGNGNCDKFGTLTLPNGASLIIEVRRTW